MKQDSIEENRAYIDEFLDFLVKGRGYSEKTAISYAHDLKRLEDYLIKHDLLLKDFVFEDAREFSLDLYNEKLKPATINRILSANRSFFHNLCENSVTNVQPFERISRAKQGQRLPTVLTREEVELLLNCDVSDYTSLMENTLFNIFYSTGCRLSEVVNMKLSDIDEKNRRILVCGKGNKQRFVFLTGRAIQALHRYFIERKHIISQNRKCDDDILFLNKKGKKLPLSSVHVIFDKYRDKFGFSKKFTPHVFRHTFATHLLDNNSDIRFVQALLGHESIGTTQIYTHVTGKKLEKVYREAHPHSRKNGGLKQELK